MLAVIAVVIYYDFFSHMNMSLGESDWDSIHSFPLSYPAQSKKVWSVSDVVTHYWKYSV